MKVLIVDDSRPIRNLMRRTMRQAGFGDHDYIEAENGVEALAMVEKEDPDLIVSDWNMPEMDGLTFLEKLRESGNQTPFGFATTEGSPEMRKKAADAGADFHLTKPFTKTEIVNVMECYF